MAVASSVAMYAFPHCVCGDQLSGITRMERCQSNLLGDVYPLTVCEKEVFSSVRIACLHMTWLC